MKHVSKIIDNVLNETSGKHALDWVAKISQYNRMRGSIDYHEIVERVINELNKYDLDEVKLHKYPADGKSKSWEWVAPLGWDITSGELRLINPHEEVLCRFKETPMCVLGYSKKCDVTAELIDVGRGTREEDYEGKDVQGKIVLMEAPEIFIPPIYVKKGALGIIVFPNPKKATGYRDMTNYNRFPVKLEILEKTTFGFSITYEKALYLKELLKKGPVNINAKIDARIIYDGEIEVISAAIHGTELPQEEIILTAHICHAAAGANDNASGSAGLIEFARSLTSLIKKKVLPPPKRTIRCLWVPEFDGTWPWAKENENKVKNALINLNLDMIGEHPLKIGEPFNVCLAPYSRPSILNDILQYFTIIIADHPKGIAINGTIVPMRFRILPFSGGSDQQVFVDSAIGIPGSMFGHSDPLWHTSLDTIEYCDSTEMQRVIGIALCTSYIFATLDDECLIDIMPIIEQGFYQRLGSAKKMLLELYNTMTTNDNRSEPNKKEISAEEKAILGIGVIEATINHEKEILQSLKRFSPKSPLEQELLLIKQRELDQWDENHRSLWIYLCKEAGIDIKFTQEPEDLKNKWALCITSLMNLEDLFPIAMSSQFDKIKLPEPPKLWWGDLHELINLVGRSFDLKMICATLTLEYQHLYYPTNVLKFLKFLERKKLIKTILIAK